MQQNVLQAPADKFALLGDISTPELVVVLRLAL